MPRAELTALDVGQAWAEAEDGPGTVIGAFGRAAYVSVGARVLALVDDRSEPGPLYARFRRLPAVSVGQPVELSRGSLDFGSVRMAVSGPLWAPPPLSPDTVLGSEPMLAELVSAVPLLDLGKAGSRRWEDVRALLGRGDVSGACSACVGRGRGLTPAGDDAAAGFLLVHALTGATPGAELMAIAEGASTHAVSRAFLSWAARGQSIPSVHDLIAAASAGNRDSARAALSRLAEVGHTSGMDMAAGVTAAISALARREASTAQVQTLR